jgi:hypothetical protein
MCSDAARALLAAAEAAAMPLCRLAAMAPDVAAPAVCELGDWLPPWLDSGLPLSITMVEEGEVCMSGDVASRKVSARLKLGE